MDGFNDSKRPLPGLFTANFQRFAHRGGLYQLWKSVSSLPDIRG